MTLFLCYWFLLIFISLSNWTLNCKVQTLNIINLPNTQALNCAAIFPGIVHGYCSHSPYIALLAFLFLLFLQLLVCSMLFMHRVAFWCIYHSLIIKKKVISRICCGIALYPIDWWICVYWSDKAFLNLPKGLKLGHIF